MFQIKEIVNSIFKSVTYILYSENKTNAWLVDIGDIEPIKSFLDKEHLGVEGVFLTHAHFDHIYGLLSLIKYYPTCCVYATPYTRIALASDKLNLSRYSGRPIQYDGKNVVVVHDKDDMVLFDNEPKMEFYETPGHNPGCLTMVLGDLIFTGDAYIPGVKVNTSLPFANKDDARTSLNRIQELSAGKIILPGHYVL